MFEFMDHSGIGGRTAEAHLVLGNGHQITVRAGGGVHSSAGVNGHATYEVLMTDDAPRFWRRYTDTAGVVYAYVPRLLVTHYVTRSGGVRDIICEVAHRPRKCLATLRMSLPESMKDSLRAALRGVAEVQLISEEFVLK